MQSHKAICPLNFEFLKFYTLFIVANMLLFCYVISSISLKENTSLDDDDVEDDNDDDDDDDVCFKCYFIE